MKKHVFFLIVFFGVITAFSPAFSAISAKSAVVIEATTGTVVYEKNAGEILPEASTTKIMTALIAIENCPLDKIITISKEAAEVEGSAIGLFEGDKVSLSDLLYMMMLKSGNDAALAIAEGVCGSVGKFVDMMNARAKSLGCTSTNFTNPHGLPDDLHQTTAYELAIIAAEAYKNETFKKIVSSKTAKLDYMGLVIENSNKMLDLYEYSNGMKTGFTKKAGRCLVSSAEKDGISLICVTLNAPDDWNDHLIMLEESFNFVEKVVLYKTGEYCVSQNALGGSDKVYAINTQPIYGLKINGQIPDYKIIESLPPFIFAPIESGKTVGYISLVFNGSSIEKIPLAVKNTVKLSEKKRSFIEQLTFNFGKFWV